MVAQHCRIRTIQEHLATGTKTWCFADAHGPLASKARPLCQCCLDEETTYRCTRQPLEVCRFEAQAPGTVAACLVQLQACSKAIASVAKGSWICAGHLRCAASRSPGAVALNQGRPQAYLKALLRHAKQQMNSPTCSAHACTPTLTLADQPAAVRPQPALYHTPVHTLFRTADLTPQIT